MAAYKNMMESVVEEKFSEVSSSLNCCKCSRCRADVIAYALNHLPAKYVVTHEGELYTRLHLLREEYKIPILSALALGARMVKENPKHESESESV